MIRAWLLFFLCFYGALLPVGATHIIGGNIQYKRIAPFTYEIRLDYYKDCADTSLDYPPANLRLGLFQKSNHQLILDFLVEPSSIDTLEIKSSDCYPQNVFCITRRSYLDTLSLGSLSLNAEAGYYLSYEQCCRFTQIENIKAPFASGITFYAELPAIQDIAGIEVQQNSPGLLAEPSFVLCNNEPYRFQMQYVDADADRLVYSLQNPLEGNTTELDPNGSGVGTPQPGPYAEAIWQSPYSLSNIMPSQMPLRIDSITGVIEVWPNQPGLFLYTVVVDEFRGTKKIARHYQDFLFRVIDCPERFAPEITWLNPALSEWKSNEERCAEYILSDIDSADQLGVRLDSFAPWLSPTDVTTTLDSSSRPFKLTVCVKVNCQSTQPADTNFVIILDDNSCPVSLTDTLLMELPLIGIDQLLDELELPTAFSPNGDGFNDQFRLKNNPSHNCYKGFKLSIYDRYGKKVFQTDEISFQWNGEAAASGVYYCAMELQNLKKVSLLQILR